MDTRSFHGVLLATVVVLLVSNATAAPIPTLGPVDITGTIVRADWVPEAKIKGIPGMSGTLGIDRVIRARFMVMLERIEGVDAKTARRMTSYLDPSVMQEPEPPQGQERILLQLNHADKDFLKKGMRITVKGYKIAGDEGGTWTDYEEIKILQE